MTVLAIMNIALPASIFVSVLKYLTVEKLISLSGGLVYTFLSVIIGLYPCMDNGKNT